MKSKKKKPSVLLRNKRKNESWFKYIMGLLHLWIGLLTGIIIVVVSLTGAIYVFQNEINKFCDSEAVYLKVKTDNITSVNTVITNFSDKFKKQPHRIYIPLEKDENIKVVSGKGKKSVVAFFHRENGTFIAQGNNSYAFFGWILRLHRWLLVRGTGDIIVGICTLAFTLMLFSGLVLWFPTKKKKVKSAFLMKRKSKIGRLIYDLHNVVGFYSSALLLMVAITGLCFSFSWFAKGTLYLFKTTEERVIVEPKRKKPKKKKDEKEVKIIAPFDDLISETNEKLTHNGRITIYYPNRKNPNLVVRKYNSENWLGVELPDQVEFSTKGEFKKVALFKNKPRSKQARFLIFPLHTGEIFGLPSKILYFILALISTSLPITGFLIWWRKSKARIIKG